MRIKSKALIFFLFYRLPFSLVTLSKTFEAHRLFPANYPPISQPDYKTFGPKAVIARRHQYNAQRISKAGAPSEYRYFQSSLNVVKCFDIQRLSSLRCRPNCISEQVENYQDPFELSLLDLRSHLPWPSLTLLVLQDRTGMHRLPPRYP